MSNLEIIIVALILDAIIGDPNAIWSKVAHPAALMGKAVSFVDRRLNKGSARKLKGAIGFAALCLGGLLIGWLVADIWFVNLALATVLLAQNSLAKHVGDVATALRSGLPEGRRAVAMIVGRDPDALDENGVARSAIESAAENFSDGVVAPVFWYLLLGLPGIMLYKITNTADSMIGYKNARYRDFGWAAARFDDVLNWVPARVSGLLICGMYFSANAFKIMRRDAPLHRSPNAGWPEAATAAVLGVAIAGPRSYGGELTDDPFVHPKGRKDLSADDVSASVRLLWRSWAGLVIILIIARALV